MDEEREERAASKATRRKQASPRGCVICGRPQQPRWRPFCSRRCQMVDLGRWLSGGYRLPGEEGSLPREDDGADAGERD